MAVMASQARSRLDTRLNSVRRLASEPRPHRGWIRAIRDALGMTAAELGSRLGVVQQSVVDLERSETSDTIKLETLRRVSDAMDCDLVYFFLPRASLQETVLRQARTKATRHLRAVAHNSRLEDQSVPPPLLERELDELASHFINKRGLWS